MDKIEHLFKTSIEQLVREIIAVNHGWKAARELFGEDSTLSTSTRDLKTCLQVRLLKEYAPDKVYLVKDKEESNKVGEEIYSLQLREEVGDRLYAEHLPFRVAKEFLTEQELRKFTKQSI
ncbi:hypothetical protein ACF3DV_13200 [Chlorogloeopsis fritschii PCC 9212]|uniref:Uncharacterized protein n=1 Tax=Chlorogloeopsis fritschii PCC 6912 TaxID=211165 RepID=A0A433NRQ5_CHLFR|nr:hypothetical protein [Chlorogloeopsis fritschii]RUR86880.1 hypothetical protein PCC6912_03230 [Chlorogloeopsis fritschii PCC 6912]